MADKEVKIRISAEDKVSAPAKKAEGSLKDLGERAAKAGEQILSIEKAKMGLEALKKVAEAGAAAFAKMAENSATMKGELDAVSGAFNSMAGHLGDTISKSRAFKSVMDISIGSIKEFDTWMKTNSGTVEKVFVGSIQAASWAATALLSSVGGIVEIFSGAIGFMEAGIQDISSTALDVQSVLEISVARIKGNRAEAVAIYQDMQERHAREKSGAEMLATDTRKEIEAISAMVERVWALNEKIQGIKAGSGAAGSTDRASNVAGGTGKAGESAEVRAQKALETALLASQEKYQDDVRVMRANFANDQADDRAKEQERERKQEEEHQADLLRIKKAEGKKNTDAAVETLYKLQSFNLEMKDSMKDSYTDLSAGLAQSIQAVVSGQESFGEAMQGMAADVAYAVATESTVKAAYEVAEGIAALASVVNAPLAPGHFAAAAKYAAVAALGFGAGAAVSGAGGGGSARGSSAAGGSENESNQRVRDTNTQQQAATYVIHQHFHGTYTSESAAGRKIQDAVRQANRSGISRSTT